MYRCIHFRRSTKFQSVLRTEILAEGPKDEGSFNIKFPRIFRKISSKKFVRQRIAHCSNATSFNSISLAISTGCCARVTIIHLRHLAHPRASFFFHPRSTTSQPTQNAISLASRLLFPFSISVAACAPKRVRDD